MYENVFRVRRQVERGGHVGSVGEREGDETSVERKETSSKLIATIKDVCRIVNLQILTQFMDENLNYPKRPAFVV